MVPTNNLSGEAGLRQAAQALIYEIRNLKRWPADAPANSESCWADVSQRWLPRLNGVLDALESIPPAAPVERKPNAPPPAPTDCLSLAELQALYGCLELVAAWGVAPLAGPGVRSTAQRGIIRGAALPDVARKWGARAAKLAASHPLDEAERRRRLEQCAISLERVVAAPPLATVSQRFVADAVAARLSSQTETSYEEWPTPWLARAARELLGGTLNDDGSVTPPPPYLAKRMGRLLGSVAARSVDAVLAEFAGPDELSARTNADAGAVERRVAAALAARPADVEERDVYVKSVAPQLYDVAARGAIQDGDATASSHATIARAALARLSDDEATWPALRASIALGESEPEVASTLAKLAAVSRAAHPSLCACLKTDAILGWLAGLAAFATRSKRSAYATDARHALKALVEDDGAAFVRAFLDGGQGAFASGSDGGVRFDVDKAPDDCVEGALIVLTDIAAPSLSGAVFAALLEDFLTKQRDDAMPDLDKLRFVAALAEKLDGGAMEVSGAALLRTLKAVLDDASQALRRGEEDADEAGLERVALGAVLGILELGAAKRADDEEAALKALLEPLEALSSPTRRASSFARLAVDCRARILCRGMSPSTKTAEEVDTLAAAEASLKDPHPAERAHGVVSLTKLARAFVSKRDARNKLVVEVDEEQEVLDWRPLARVCVKALGDDESYVFLAAAHALSAIADAAPGEVMPYLLEQFETEEREKTRRRLGEALVLSVRRRGEAAPAYAQKLGRAFAAGASNDRAERDRLACLSCLSELAPLCRDVGGWGLDALDLAMAGLDGRDDVTRRGAAFLGAALVTGAFLDAYPKETAKLCKRLKSGVEDKDEVVAGHCVRAMESLDVLLGERLTLPSEGKSDLHRIVGGIGKSSHDLKL